LLLELSLERKARVKAGSRLEGEGRIVHRVDVLKDRTWALNGKVIRWSDKAKYEKGGYRTVWDSIKRHFDEVQQTMGIVTIKAGSSADLISEDGNSEYYQLKQRRNVLTAELHATMDLLWGGQAKGSEGITHPGVRAHLRLPLERGGGRSQPGDDRARRANPAGVREALQKGRVQSVLGSSPDNILSHLDIDIREYDEGKAEESDLPF
jgi:hypothetical protein